MVHRDMCRLVGKKKDEALDHLVRRVAKVTQDDFAKLHLQTRRYVNDMIALLNDRKPVMSLEAYFVPAHQEKLLEPKRHRNADIEEEESLDGLRLAQKSHKAAVKFMLRSKVFVPPRADIAEKCGLSPKSASELRRNVILVLKCLCELGLYHHLTLENTAKRTHQRVL